jgi:hypothetical protein
MRRGKKSCNVPPALCLLEKPSSEYSPDNNAVIQKGDLEKINRTSDVLLRDKSGYLAGIDVFHQLHCLVGILYVVQDFHDYIVDFWSRTIFVRWRIASTIKWSQIW